jgi:hypothetical protein
MHATAIELNEEMTNAALSARRCRCGSKMLVRYEPGITYILCIKENKPKMAVPDWDPTGLVEKWNKKEQP